MSLEHYICQGAIYMFYFKLTMLTSCLLILRSISLHLLFLGTLFSEAKGIQRTLQMGHGRTKIGGFVLVCTCACVCARVCVCVSECMHMHNTAYLWRSEESSLQELVFSSTVCVPGLSLGHRVW